MSELLKPSSVATGTEEIQKEQFTDKLEEQKLLSQIAAWEAESEDFYALLKRIWEQNIEYYKGNQTDVNKIFGKESKAVENRIWMGVETIIPIATAKLPDTVVKPGDDDEQSAMDARDLQDVLNMKFEDVGIQAKGEQWLRDLLVKRYGVFKVCWDFEADDVDVKVIDPRRVRVPKYGTSVAALAFTIEDLELTYNSLVSSFGEAHAKDVLTSHPKESVNKKRKVTYSVKEVWTNDFVVWATDTKILKKQANPYYDFKNKKNNFFTEPRKPYVIKSVFQTEESIIGDTDYIQQSIRMQDNLNTRKRQIENITSKVANPFLLIDSDVMSEEEAANITNEPGAILYGKDAASGTKIRFESPGQVPQYLFTDLEFTRKEMDNMWGLHSTTRGEREGRETAAGREMLREADMGRIDLVARTLERALDEIAEYWTQLIKQYYTEEKTFTILGQDGMRFVKNFSGQKVAPGVKPFITQGSTLKEDERSMKQNALLLWQNKALGLKTLYKMLRIPNMQEAIEDFVETQSGALLQQGARVEGIVPPNGAGAAMPPKLGI